MFRNYGLGISKKLFRSKNCKSQGSRLLEEDLLNCDDKAEVIFVRNYKEYSINLSCFVSAKRRFSYITFSQ